MDTAEEIGRRFGKGVKAKYVANCDRYFGSALWRRWRRYKGYATHSENMYHSFLFVTTPEGFDFWNGIAHKLDGRKVNRVDKLRKLLKKMKRRAGK